mmetsp:Transcript_30209/g.63186  ORF Transcript_30209/g.63186 Transcript_30209/m.63186 type:complete len:753 (+) Transcript_30209:158-2416(+)
MSTNVTPKVEDGKPDETSSTASPKESKSRRAVRRSHSGDTLSQSRTRPQRGTDRHQSSTSRSHRRRETKLSPGRRSRDGSVKSADSTETDDDSVHSDSSGNLLNEHRKQHKKKDRHQGSRTDKGSSDQTDQQKRRNTSRRNTSRSSEPLRREVPNPRSKSRPSVAQLRYGKESLRNVTAYAAPGSSLSPNHRERVVPLKTHDESPSSDRRIKSPPSHAKPHHSSRKQRGASDKGKQRPRSHRTPVSSRNEHATPKSDGTLDPKAVSEKEILNLLTSCDPPLVEGDNGTQQQVNQSRRLSNSSGSELVEENSNGKRSPTRRRHTSEARRRRSNSAHAIDAKARRALRRASNDDDEKKVRRTRKPPSRSKSSAGPPSDDSKGLDNFLKQSVSTTTTNGKGPRGTRTVVSAKSFSGAKSVVSTGVRSMASTRGSRGRRRRKEPRSAKLLNSTTSDTTQEGNGDGKKKSLAKSKRRGLFTSRRLVVDSDSDDGNLDLDLATARNNFAQQHVNAKLQMHLNKTDELLYSVFPKHVADDLRNGLKVAPEKHEIVTIFFSDIVGFTDISSQLNPMKISDMLDRLYNSFDALSDYHDVFKVETIGDAYMAVTNLTKEQPDHCKRITEFSIDAIRVANQTLIDEDNEGMGYVNIRVGFHSGSVVSNVVGTRNPRYCLFGDTVNTASRMESNSEKNRIHCSEASANLLRGQCPKMKIFPRGTITVKGKGEMKTFWIHEEGSFSGKDSKKSGTIRSFMKALGR